MKYRLVLSLFALAFASGQPCQSAAADDDVNAVLDRAIKALGGEAALKSVKAATMKTKGTISFGGNESSIESVITFDGLSKFRQDFTADFGGMEIQGSNVLNGDTGFRSFNGMVMELDENGVAMAKQSLYLQVVPKTLLALKGDDFKVEKGKDGALKVTGPDKKTFTLSFDAKTGLPAKLVASVQGFQGGDVSQEVSFSEYKAFDGIKVATKIVAKRDGETFTDVTVTTFKKLKKVDPAKFKTPE